MVEINIFRNFAFDMLELNEVQLEGSSHAYSMMALEEQITCLTVPGGALHQTPVRWLFAMLGLEPVRHGFISIDGEPLSVRSASAIRKLMSYVPYRLDDVGEISVYHAPTAGDVFALKANRKAGKRSLQEEERQTGAVGQQARLLATAVMLNRPVLLVDRPSALSMSYLRRQANAGRTVIVASNDAAVIAASDNVVEIHNS